MVRGSETANRLAYCLKPSAPKEIRQAAIAEVSAALVAKGGDISAAAEVLGIGRATLNRWIADHASLKKTVDTARRNGPA